MFWRQYKLRDRINVDTGRKKCSTVAGQNPALDTPEELLADEIIELSLMKVKVERSFTATWGKMIEDDAGLECFKASTHWLFNFMNGFGWCKINNLTTLTDDQLLQGAVDYM